RPARSEKNRISNLARFPFNFASSTLKLSLRGLVSKPRVTAPARKVAISAKTISIEITVHDDKKQRESTEGYLFRCRWHALLFNKDSRRSLRAGRRRDRIKTKRATARSRVLRGVETNAAAAGDRGAAR